MIGGSKYHPQKLVFGRFWPRPLWMAITAREVMGKKLCKIAKMGNGPVCQVTCVPGLSAKQSGCTGMPKILKNFNFWQFLRPLTAAVGQTAGQTTSGRTPANPAWNDLQKMVIHLAAPQTHAALCAKNTTKNCHFFGVLTLPPIKGRKAAGNYLWLLLSAVRAGHCGSKDTFRFLVAPPGGPQGPIHKGIVKFYFEVL